MNIDTQLKCWTYMYIFVENADMTAGTVDLQRHDLQTVHPIFKQVSSLVKSCLSAYRM